MDSVTIGSASHPGQTKKDNEDYYAYFLPKNSQARKKGTLLALADGMGGHVGGALASRTAVETLISEYYEDRGDDISVALKAAFLKANAEVFAKGLELGAPQGIGTTLTAVVLKNGRMYYAHVGDSRGYLIDRNAISQFTKDHSFVGGLVRSGAINPEDALTHPDRNIITRAVGIDEDLEVDVPPSALSLKPDQYVLLCCDGLYTVVSDADIHATVVQQGDPSRASETLVAQANANGGPDNITVLIARIDQIGILANWKTRLRQHVRI
jgi:protein phosphatase